MADLKDLAEQYGVAKAQDQNENLGRLAEMLGSARDIGNEYKVPSWVPLAGGAGAGDLLMGRTPEEIENWSYGNAPMQIPEMSNVPQFKRGRAQSLADALTTLAPGVKATEGLPAGLSFIGPKSRNWDKVAAELAAKKLDEGADPAEVWREHLIGRMPDNTLFSEIDDSKFRLSNSNDYDAMIADKRKAMAENIAQQKEFESLKNAESPQLDLYPKEFKKAINEKISNLKNDRNYIRDELSGDLGLEHGLGSFEGQRARNAFQHPDLINAYPELTNDSIIKQNRMLGSGVRGQLSGTNIDLSNNLLDYPDEAASTALHEFQHAIQNHEGWGKGSNPLTSQSDYYNFLGKKFKDIDGSNILSKFNELSGKSEPYYRIKQIQDLQNISQPRQLFNSSDYYKYSRELKDLLGAPPKYGSKLPWAQDAGNIIANKIKDELTWNGKDLLESIGNDRDFAKKMIRSIEGKQNRIGYDKYSDAYKTSQEMQRTDPRFKDLPNEEKMKLYQRSAGEAQARATQDRLDMDMAQRRENYPLAGGKLSDIPLEDLIYKYAEGGKVDIRDDEGGKVESAVEDYKQLLSGYPNAEKFFTGLKDAAYRSVPTTEQMRDPNFIIDNAGFGGIIKPKGGNWLDAFGRTPEKAASQFSRSVDPELESYARSGMHLMPHEYNETVPKMAVNDWLKQKLGKYIQNEMGTPEDPVRRIAEEWPAKRDVLISQQQSKIPNLQELAAKYEDMGLPPEVIANRMANSQRDISGIQEKISELEGYNPLHYKPRDPGEFDIDDVMAKREELGYPAEGIAKTNLGKLWEHYADENIQSMKVYDVNGMNNEMYKEMNPWLEKLNDEDQVYLTNTMVGTGFDKLADELRNAAHPDSNLPDFLRIDPAKLSRVSMPQAVEHVAKINAWRDAERLKEGRNAATVMHKEYPDKGLAWMQMRMPENQDKEALRAALKFEGDTMGHCVGQYCDEVAGGDSNIYSLRDRRGEPHVTIETKNNGYDLNKLLDLNKQMINEDSYLTNKLKFLQENYANRPERQADLMLDTMKKYGYDYQLPEPMGKIVQIKGKQNEAPVAKYLPAVHDFVRSKDWSSVGDLQNTLLTDLRQDEKYMHPDIYKMATDKYGKFATDDEMDALRDEFYIKNKDIPLKGFAKGGKVSMDDLHFNDDDALRMYHQEMDRMGDKISNTGASKKTGKGTARVNYSTLTKGDIGKEIALHTLMANYGVDVGDLNLDAGLIKPMEADGLYIGDLTGSLPLGEGRASLGVQGIHSKYDDGLSGYTAGYNGKVGDGNLSARYFEPADHNSAGRQVQLEYALPFAKGGEVKDLHNKYEESDYGYGNRPDKTKKGLGYFGELERPDGTGVMTEYSIGVPINGEEMDVPTLIPTLTPDEIRLILHMQDGEDMPRSIVHKAIDHAHQRLSEGKPIFATDEDLYAHGGIVDVLHNDAIEQIMKAFMESMTDEEESSAPAVSIQITTQSQPLKSGKIPTSIREAKHG